MQDEEDVKVNADRTLDFSQAGWKVGPYDLNAVEAGVRLVEEHGGEMAVLTAAGVIVTDSKMKKAVLSRGPEQMYAVQDEAIADADSLGVAKILAAGVAKIGDVDLVLCGEGSGDSYAQMTGSLLGRLLGWSTVNAVSALSYEDDHVVVDRIVEDGVEVLDVPLPAVISVTSDINTPRIAGMKDILAAGKKPSTIWPISEVGTLPESKVTVASVLAPEQAERQNTILEGDSPETVSAFCDLLRKAL